MFLISIGTQRRTQCPDIAHRLQSVIAKGLDNLGSATVAQSDIETYYGSLPVLRIVRWLTTHAAYSSHAACPARHQMLPHVISKYGTVEIAIGSRTVGGLTSSRAAGFSSRTPVEATIVDRLPHWKQHELHTAQGSLCMRTWVDNSFGASD